MTKNSAEEDDDVANCLLLFTSSLAVKALASILTAIILNLYIRNRSEEKNSNTLAAQISSIESIDEYRELLKSTILETEHLSPPVISIMRRITREI